MKSKHWGILRRLGCGTLVSLVLLLGGLEVTLRLAPGVLAAGLANQVYSDYHARAAGVYSVDSVTGIRVFKPNFERDMYSHGYRWKHKTDQRGFRNRPEAGSEVVLLGDSQIYGHGVELEQTVGEVLHQRFGREVYNLSRQGDCLYNSYVMSRLYLPELKPKVVICFVFSNDFGDVLAYRPPVAGTPELTWDYPSMRERLANLPTASGVLDHSYAYRLFRGLQLAWRTPTVDHAAAHDRAYLRAELVQEAGTYYQQVLPAMQKECTQLGAELRVVYLHLDFLGGMWDPINDTGAPFIKELCAQHSIPFASTRELFAKREDVFLYHDWHLSPKGHADLAVWLEDWLSPQGSIAPGSGR